MTLVSQARLLGTGWKFPPEFSALTHSVAMVSGVADIRESLLILLSTRPGDRVMLPRYGCDLNRFVFRDLDATMVEELRDTVVTAIRMWERRIEVLDCRVADDSDRPATVVIVVSFRVRGTGDQDMVEYAFGRADPIPQIAP